MQAELVHARRQRGDLAEAHAARKQIARGVARFQKAQSAHATIHQRLQLRIGHRGVGHGNAAQSVASLRQRIQQRGWVHAIRRGLHQYAARRAQRVQHLQVARHGRIRRRVGRRMLQGKAVIGAEHMAMRIARQRGQRVLGRDGHARHFGIHARPFFDSGAKTLKTGWSACRGVSSGAGVSSGMGISCAFKVMDTMV
ncbi:hypothetical protein D3C71_1610920 [compost metagenome]